MVKIQSTVLAVDPGSMKCGLAVVSGEMVRWKQVVKLSDFDQAVTRLCTEYTVSVIVIGDGTNSKNILSRLTMLLKIPIFTVDEEKSSLEGRYRFLKENSRGLSRLLPVGLRVPHKPYDDYVAVVLAERFLKKNPNFSPEQPIL